MINSINFQTPKFFRPPQYGEIITFNGRQYFIGNSINQGNFGQVFECEDEWGNELAAKVLTPRNQSYEDVWGQWLREKNNLINLRHPNITYIHTSFECENTFYIILERCHSTLNNVIEIKQYDMREALLPYIARDILQALDFIHNYKEGYVHLDIHPGNIFVFEVKDIINPEKDPIYKFKIGDLGISRPEKYLNVSNTMAQWMLPPEHFNETEFGNIQRQVDIYHTGLLLLSLLLGYVPQFTQQEILDGKPRKIAESLSSPYSDAIAKALRRHVADRTQSALDLWREISEASQ
ncbi:MAG: protein kinase family protein [Dolichospermum lemmermannii FEM_B0920]